MTALWAEIERCLDRWVGTPDRLAAFVVGLSLPLVVLAYLDDGWTGVLVVAAAIVIAWFVLRLLLRRR